MAEGKKSFLLYCDIITTVEKLSNEQAGKLFKTILEYVNDKNPIIDDIIIDLVFEPIKQGLKRDLKKYENICERNKSNGSKGGRPKEPKKPNGLIGNPKKPKKADNDNDSDIDNDIDSDKEINKRNNKNVVLDFPIDENFKESLLLWFDYKKQIKDAYKTDIGKQKCYKMLIELSNNNPDKAKKIVDQSIANNWKGLFELKETKPKQQQPPYLKNNTGF